MSLGACFCPCVLNGHSPTDCTGQADTHLPRRPSMAAHLELPVCQPCYDMVITPHDTPLVAPLDSGHVPDAPALTAARLRSAVHNHPNPPQPTERPQ